MNFYVFKMYETRKEIIVNMDKVVAIERASLVDDKIAIHTSDTVHFVIADFELMKTVFVK